MELERDCTGRNADFCGETFDTDETVTMDFGRGGRTTCYLLYGEQEGTSAENRRSCLEFLCAELMREGDLA